MPDRPVFVDPTGRRRRTIRVTAIIGAGVLLGVGALLVAALLGAPIAPTASLPEPVPAAPAAGGAAPQEPPPVVDTPTQPRPTTSRRPDPGAAPVTTTTPTPTTTTTTPTKGKPGHTPPGRPTDLPTPPGRTR